MSKNIHAFKGIVLAGGSGSRLYPMNLVASKQLQAVYDKPMIYYPLSTLMLLGVQEILIISTPKDTPRFQELLGDGSQLGIRLFYQVQPKPEGIAQAFLIGEDFLQNRPVCFILGDSIFYGPMDIFRQAIATFKTGATLFGYPVRNPEQYGVVSFDEEGKILTLEEKPATPKSKFAVPGFYLYDSKVLSFAKELRPSPRGELEITDLNRKYLAEGSLNLKLLGRGIGWLDAGTHESLLAASNFVYSIEKRQGLKVGCLEEVAIRQGFISEKQAFTRLIKDIPVAELCLYLERVWDEVHK